MLGMRKLCGDESALSMLVTTLPRLVRAHDVECGRASLGVWHVTVDVRDGSWMIV